MIIGRMETAVSSVPMVSTRLSRQDILGSWKARWGYKRMHYTVPPGLYAVGNPTHTSPVMVSANYKMSFDRLRKNLTGVNAWVLVLDTRGINVWCAAGKGTFCAEEIAHRIEKTHLKEIVTHRTLILPQLSAPGVAVHQLFRLSGFRALYGPVRAEDIQAYLANGKKATEEMRTVYFTLRDRLVLVPMEVVNLLRPVIAGLAALGVLKIFGASIRGEEVIPVQMLRGIFTTAIPYLGAVAMGAVLVPALLPYLPGRSFAWKGWFLGVLWTVAYLLFTNQLPGRSDMAALLLILPAISSYLALNFTGASTYTSLSGVMKEIRMAKPLLISCVSLGVVFLVRGMF